VTHFVEVFYSEHCPGCSEARRIVRQLVSTRPDIAVAEFDIAVHVGMATRYGLIATPAVVIDGGAVLYGVPRVADLESRVDTPVTGRDGEPAG